MIYPKRALYVFALLVFCSTGLRAKDTFEEYFKEYPNQQQVKMMHAWLEKYQAGTFQFTGLVTPAEDTVVSPQATVDYGYNWFSISDGPAIIRTPQYDKFFSVSIFDMKHNVPAVIVSPDKPILLVRPGQEHPKGDFTVVELETDQGLVFTRMVVVNNMQEVRRLSKSIKMQNGQGDMHRDVQRFSPEIVSGATAMLQALSGHTNPDDSFGKKSGDVGTINLASGVMSGQLGTPPDSVRYAGLAFDESGQRLNGTDTYIVTVPAGIIHDNGYYSVTVYGLDNRLLIPNDKKIYDRTTYTSEKNPDGSYTVTLSPSGDGLNGIPTGKPFYGILRAYLPIQGASMAVKLVKQ